MYTVSGTVDGDNLTGSASVNSVSGMVTLQRSSLPDVKINTVSGDIALDLTSGSSRIRSNSVSGDVTVRAPLSGFDVEANTASGSIVVDGRQLLKGFGGGSKGHERSVTSARVTVRWRSRPTRCPAASSCCAPTRRPPRRPRRTPHRPPATRRRRSGPRARRRCRRTPRPASPRRTSPARATPSLTLPPMSPVFAHGQLRLYLLVLPDEGPRHGYEVIQESKAVSTGCTPRAPARSTPGWPSWRRRDSSSAPTRGARRRTRSPRRAGPRSGRGRPMSRTCGTTSTSRCGKLAEQVRSRVQHQAADLRTELKNAAREARATATPVGGHEPWTRGEPAATPTSSARSTRSAATSAERGVAAVTADQTQRSSTSSPTRPTAYGRSSGTADPVWDGAGSPAGEPALRGPRSGMRRVRSESDRVAWSRARPPWSRHRGPRGRATRSR